VFGFWNGASCGHLRRLVGLCCTAPGVAVRRECTFGLSCCLQVPPAGGPMEIGIWLSSVGVGVLHRTRPHSLGPH
jgi:hypothetical protein